ncbi:hypothetical protein V6N13_063910 [Hibiscus sabdariffa]
MRHHQRMSNDAINTSYNSISHDHIFEDVDPLLEWLQEKEHPLLDGENVGISSATPTQSSGDGQDSDTGGLIQIYDDDRESCDRGEISSSRRHEKEYGIGSASGHFHHMSEFGGNMSATPSASIKRSESRA